MAGLPTRRAMMIGGAALTVAARTARAEPLQVVPSGTPGSAMARGTVREALEAGHATGKGTPLKDVLVSNGRDVVRTDAFGRYSLPVEPGQTIFVVKPSGFEVPIDPTTRLPKFSYVHDPYGTPASLRFRYGGMPATGPLPVSIDFELKRTPEPDKYDVVLLTDPQPQSTAEIAFVRDDVVSGLIGTDAAFGITCGDIAFNDLSMYGRINKIIGRIGIPWRNIGGNHDFDCEAPDATRARDTFKSVYGAPYHAFEHGKALFVMLDNVEYLGPHRTCEGSKEHYRGFFPPDQLAFVETLLAATPKDRLVVFVMHIPLKTYLGDDPARSTVNAADLLKLIGDRPSVSFSGHTHSTEHHYLGAEAGFTGATPHHHHVLTAVSGSWWSGPRDHRGIASADSYDGTPNGHHVLSVDGSSYTTRFVAAAEPAQQMRISLEPHNSQGTVRGERRLSMVERLRSPVSIGQAAATRVVVNVFDGGPKTKVSLAVDGGKPIEMKRATGPDPFFVEVFDRHHETFKEWVSPQPCSHLWEAALPRDLLAGAYALQVTAADEYGRRHTDSMVLEVV